MIIWEELETTNAGYMSRTRVPGGWLVRLTMDVRSPIYSGYVTPPYEHQEGYEWRSSICFYPDPEHKWNPQGGGE